MANPKHLALLKQGVEAWNEWRWANSGIQLDLRGANLSGANLRGADLGGADLGGADLGGADFSEVNFIGANLSGVNLIGAKLIGINLRKADLRLSVLNKADLSRADLSGTDLRGADLYGTNLGGVNLHKAELDRVDLSGKNLSRVDLSEADLNETDLRGTDLSGADLSRVNLYGANLSGADLSEAILTGTVLANTKLVETKGLSTCRHIGPSILDFHTLQKSGPLPLAFLRGCGLPDLLINYLLSLSPDQPIQYYSCFISYSSMDEDFAQHLHDDLQNKGVRCWLAIKDIQGGQKIYEQIRRAIQHYDKLLLILSKHSVNSKWVKTEIIKALDRKVGDKNLMLFPIRIVDFETIQRWECFDSDTGMDLAREIREYFIPDFSNWKSPDAYQQAFDRLLRDLKLELERKPETA